MLDNISNRTLLIVPNNLKNYILETINKENKLINIKVMTIKEFSDAYFFSYTKETIHFLVNKYNISVENAILFLDNMKYVLNLKSTSNNIIYLQELYQDLVNNNLLVFDLMFKPYLENIDIIILSKDNIEPFYLNILAKYNPTYYDLELPKRNKSIPTYKFKSLEEEVSFLFNEISSLIKKGISPSNIKIMNATSEYINIIKRFSNLYKIKVSDFSKVSIYGTKVVKEILNLVKENKTREDILLYLENYKESDIYNKIFNILCDYYFTNDLSSCYEELLYDFKNTYLSKPLYNDLIEVLSVNPVNFDYYIYLIGFNLENIPTTYKDISYLNDSLKKEIGLFTSIEANKLERGNLKKIINSFSNLVITYKETDPYKSYYPSSLLEELDITYYDTLNINTTSNLYNKIKLASNLDLMLKYGTKTNDTSILYNTYQDINYSSYDNRFTGLENFNLEKLSLSYTSLNNFYYCSFRFYIDNILKLNIYEDTFKIFIGNLFHFILSKIYQDDFDFETLFTEYLNTRTFSSKELFYLSILKEELKDLIKVILDSKMLTGLDKVKLEQEIKLKFGLDTFKGIIDKIMYKEKDNNTYISLIDYKTGNPSLDMSNLQYGIDMQLPIYVYLVKKSKMFLNPQIIGFYFQKILHEKLSYDPKKTFAEANLDNLKLMGYSINDPYLVSMFDSSYENSQMIKGMKTTSKGFAYYSKVLSEDAINNLVDIVDLKIQEAFKSIKEGEFNINPKVIKGENIGCSFCSYKDLCFKTGKDLVYLEGNDDLSYLEGGENA